MEEQVDLNNQRPKISVVIPTFNSEKTLGRLLESIINQTHKNTEIVIIDGVSSDSTNLVIEKYSVAISYHVSEPDNGIYDAINKGIRASSGDLIVIAGSDDYFFSEKVFEEVSSAYNKKRYDIYAGKTIFKSRNGIDSYREDASYGLECLIDGIPVGHNAMFVRNESYDDVGLYDTSYKICGDAQWFHRAIKKSKTLLYLDIDVINFSMDGTSSNNNVAIMDETYRTIIENFPNLDKDDAACIFKCYRGWEPRSLVYPIIKKYQNDIKLMSTLGKAFPEYYDDCKYTWRFKNILIKIKNKFI